MAGRAFIYDTTTGEIKYFASPALESETEDGSSTIRSINNDGVGVGYLGDYAAKFDFATGENEKILNESSIANYITNDGKIFGLTYDDNYVQTPVIYSEDGVVELPQPTEAWLGYEFDGMAVRSGNADGSVLIGYPIDNFATFPLVIWALNKDNTTYSLVPASKKYLDPSFDLDGPQDYDTFAGAAISQNGKYVSIDLHKKTDDWEAGYVIARYNVETDTYETITCPESDSGMAYYATGVSNDGTIVGYMEDMNTNARYAMICKGDETEAKRMTAVFPTLTDLAKMEANESNTPCGITADGKYIVGYGYVDYDDENLIYATYYIDTTESTDGVDNVTDESKSNKVVSSYTVDGKKTRSADAGLRINKLMNGKTVKSLMK